MVSPQRVFFQMSPITVAEWEIEFPDDTKGLLPMMAAACRLPSRSKQVETFRGGGISQKMTTTSQTSNFTATFLLDQSSVALDWLYNWYDKGGRKDIDVYLIRQLQIVSIAAIPQSVRLRQFKLFDTQLVGLSGLPLNSQMGEIIRQEAEFTVDSVKYGRNL